MSLNFQKVYKKQQINVVFLSETSKNRYRNDSKFNYLPPKVKEEFNPIQIIENSLGI